MQSISEVFNHQIERRNQGEDNKWVNNSLEIGLAFTLHSMVCRVFLLMRDTSNAYFSQFDNPLALGARQIVCITAAIATIAASPIGVLELPIRLVESGVIAACVAFVLPACGARSSCLQGLGMCVVGFAPIASIIDSVCILGDMVDIQKEPKGTCIT
ncbi:MAG: hypothetical protein S4CHLAM102_01650 [Chlamydiia bacterium]|nr:hypothetical protein [Chlamydiia bacterium]